MSKLHQLAQEYRNSVKETVKEPINWSSSTVWETIADNLSDLKFSYKGKGDKPLITMNIHPYGEQSFYVLMETPQIIIPLTGNGMESNSEYRCPPKWDTLMEDLSIVIKGKRVD